MKRILGLIIMVSMYNAQASQVITNNDLEIPLEISYRYENSAGEERIEKVTIASKTDDLPRQFSGKKMGKGRPGGALKRISYGWTAANGIKGRGGFDIDVIPQSDEDLSVKFVGSGKYNDIKVDKTLIRRPVSAKRPESPRRARAGSSADIKQSKADEMDAEQLRERIRTLESQLAECKRQLNR